MPTLTRISLACCLLVVGTLTATAGLPAGSSDSAKAMRALEFGDLPEYRKYSFALPPHSRERTDRLADKLERTGVVQTRRPVINGFE
jgi:hypothetical protein